MSNLLPSGFFQIFLGRNENFQPIWSAWHYQAAQELPNWLHFFGHAGKHFSEILQTAQFFFPKFSQAAQTISVAWKTSQCEGWT
jgi:hypothetical protein